MTTPDDRVYAESHEWHMVDGEIVTIGLSQFAVDQLTDVTFVEMREVGYTFETGDAIGEVESVKTTSDVYPAVGGEIVEVNAAVIEDPSLLNSDPYGKGWLVKIKVSDDSGLASCVDATTYDANNG